MTKNRIEREDIRKYKKKKKKKKTNRRKCRIVSSNWAIVPCWFCLFDSRISSRMNNHSYMFFLIIDHIFCSLFFFVVFFFWHSQWSLFWSIMKYFQTNNNNEINFNRLFMDIESSYKVINFCFSFSFLFRKKIWKYD